MAADASRLLRRAAAERAVDPRHRQHDQAAVWPAGRSDGGLQPAEARATLALLPHLPDGEPAAGAWGRCAAGRRTHAKAWSGRTVVAAASPGTQPLAGAAARRRRLGRRTGDVACRAGGAGLSVSPAHDSTRQ